MRFLLLTLLASVSFNYATELMSASEALKTSITTKKAIEKKIKEDKIAQEFINNVLNEAAKEIDKRTKKELYTVIQLDISMPKSMIYKYAGSETYVIYETIYKALESKGYKHNNKPSGFGYEIKVNIYWGNIDM